MHSWNPLLPLLVRGGGGGGGYLATLCRGQLPQCPSVSKAQLVRLQDLGNGFKCIYAGTLFQFAGNPGGHLLHLVVLFGRFGLLGRPSSVCLDCGQILIHLLLDQSDQTPTLAPSDRCL